MTLHWQLIVLVTLGGVLCSVAEMNTENDDPTAQSHMKSSTLDVFVLPHAHCDVGWLKTVEGYFNDQVSDILTTVTNALDANASRRFIWSEIKWLQMWWPNQTDAMRAKMRRIVRSGQLEFVGAGWSQNDEVTPTYFDIIDNQVTGHEYLRKIGLQDECPIKGRCVRFGWQIDMFAGFSGATPTLWALAGFDGMFSRWEGTPEQRAVFAREKAFEYLWDASASLTPNRSRIWNHIINGNYGDFAGFRCGQSDAGHSWEKPNVTCTLRNSELTFKWPPSAPVNATNIASYAELLVAFVHHRHQVYQTNAHLLVWGSDYLFTDAGVMFANMEMIMDYINARPQTYGMSLRYTTLAQYADHIHSLGVGFHVKGHPLDFEYGWPHEWNLSLTGNFTTQYQTGAPTSRAALKFKARAVGALHRSVEAANALSRLLRGSNRAPELKTQTELRRVQARGSVRRGTNVVERLLNVVDRGCTMRVGLLLTKVLDLSLLAPFLHVLNGIKVCGWTQVLRYCSTLIHPMCLR
eukprot:m.846990 g.846990  ORF g.846990 m.846990 type:complete len:521 (-) comp23479_c0_seq1:3314-4876(-)